MIKVYPGKDDHQLMAFCMDIIECFEDFLDRRGIVLENEDKEEDEDASNIYGMDYAELEDGVTEILYKWDLVTEEV